MKLIREEAVSSVRFSDDVAESLSAEIETLRREADAACVALGAEEGFAGATAAADRFGEEIEQYGALNPGIVAALWDIGVRFADQSDIVQRISDGDTSFISNWSEVESVAPWALSCLKLVMRSHCLKNALGTFAGEMKRVLGTEVGEIRWAKGRSAARLVYRDVHVLVEEEYLPRLIATDGTRFFWLFGERLFSTSSAYEPEDVHALIVDFDQRGRRALDRARAVKSMEGRLGNAGGRQSIPQEVRMFVWQRDGGRCVECGNQAELEFDHIIPLVMGGASTERNLQLLCAPCNNRKGGSLG